MKNLLIIPAAYVYLDQNRDSFLVMALYEPQPVVLVGGLMLKFTSILVFRPSDLMEIFDGDGIGQPHNDGEGTWRYHARNDWRCDL